MGVVLTEHGIEQNENPLYFVMGKTHEETYLQFLDDVAEHLQGVQSPELLIMYADDRVSPPSVNEAYRKLRASGVKMRQLVEEGNTYLLGELDEYRYVPNDLFINRVTLIYGDCIANETTDVLRGVVRRDPLSAELQRNSFNLLWRALEGPAESTADETF